MKITDIFGQTKEEIKIEEQTILPQKIRLFEIESSQKFFDKIFLGPYQAEIILSTKTWQEKIGSQSQLVKKFNFFAFPWKIFLILIFLGVVLLVGTVPLKRCRKRHIK